jgi:hypothetical protein
MMKFSKKFNTKFSEGDNPNEGKHLEKYITQMKESILSYEDKIQDQNL